MNSLNIPEQFGERRDLESRIMSELELLGLLVETMSDYENYTEIIDLRFTEQLLSELNRTGAQLLTVEHNRRAKAGIVPKL